MYSVVLMMALTGSTEAVEFGRHRCGGCDGYACNGVVCSGPVCGGAVVSCNGGGHHCGYNHCNGCDSCGRRGLFHRRNRGCCCPPVCASYSCGAPVCGAPVCGGVVAPAAPAPMPAPPAKKEAPAPMKTQLNAPATIVVQVPENAVLTIDGNATKQTSARRVFVTPALATGTYTIQVVNGNAVQTREVTVFGGRTTEVSFSTPSAVASR